MNQIPQSAPKSADDAGSPTPAVPLRKNPWLVFVAPYVVYMLFTQIEPSPPEAPATETATVAKDAATPATPPAAAADGTTPSEEPAAGANAAQNGGSDDAKAVTASGEPKVAKAGYFGLEYRHYPLVYTAKILATFAVLLFVLPGIRQIPFRVTLLAPLVGAIGTPLWIGLCRLETRLLPLLGLDWVAGSGVRTGFNPLVELADNPAWAYGFLGIRFLGLVVLVAMIEEFFLRGFLIRFLTKGDWWEVPIGVATRFALVAMTAAAALSHPPTEYLAAVVWFSLVSWLMLKTKSLWDCVVAHGVTNLLLGLYVVFSGNWDLM